MLVRRVLEVRLLIYACATVISTPRFKAPLSILYSTLIQSSSVQHDDLEALDLETTGFAGSHHINLGLEMWVYALQVSRMAFKIS